RRTPGLRREEVAQLAGLSVTWYTWIEQGRDVSVSPAALARLARTLQLSAAERTYLFDLAGKRDTAGPAPASDVPAALEAAVQAIAAPTYVLDRQWNAVAWNALASRLFMGWLDRSADKPGGRNLLRFIFLEPAARRLIRGWEERARRVLAEFRAECGVFAEDRGMQSLRARSAVFSRLWQAHAVLGREGGLRQFNHPKDGPLAYEQAAFALAGRPEFKLVMLLGPIGSSKERPKAGLPKLHRSSFKRSRVPSH
ncbi:MAG TPA: helix-turn-helix transcriptional regulator, partial [Dongiaceae bacterium]|nr:helix-turn-helix transcriptional regulator [Dongiaceae bacterium]